MLFFLLSYRSIFQTRTRTTIILLPSFGFIKGGTYHIDVNASNITAASLFILKDFVDYNNFNLHAQCQNHAKKAKNNHLEFSGNISLTGVLTPVLVNCGESKASELYDSTLISKKFENDSFSHNSDSNFNRVDRGSYDGPNDHIMKNQTEFAYDYNVNQMQEIEYNVTMAYSNPNFKIDSRDIFFVPLFRVLSHIYLAFLVTWLINAVKFINCRIHLHTIFTLMPFVRIISLCVWKSYSEKLMKEDINESVFNTIFDWIYFWALLVTIALVGTGWCIFRIHLETWQVKQIIFYSFLLSFTTLSLRFTSSTLLIVPLLVLMIVSVILYIKINLINLIVMGRVSEQMSKNPVVVNKIDLARQFVFISLGCLGFTAFGSSVLCAIGFHKFTCTVFYEAMLLIGNFLQMRFFLFRKKYLGQRRRGVMRNDDTEMSDESYEYNQENSDIPKMSVKRTARVVTMIEPLGKSKLALMIPSSCIY
ncbi:hypothetical protein TRFO_01757 [Tritrichomonas foetus]|uniref:Intimal thickness related receptor IRP domain-containing protein n=1 Tax=Tritrichomonas foetus TaxID=1144522 RepID=A0A1J4JUF2_9EUKA|nr:hypothetical protein TRFO_01757 [Tritrichomonas foetus]|eukprot:OHT01148.1 hypothetical protein TRFO_01757 [Tritrichomonas foetus]